MEVSKILDELFQVYTHSTTIRKRIFIIQAEVFRAPRCLCSLDQESHF